MNVEMHLIRAKHEWAYIVADDATGVFLAHGSFGCFAHTWPPQHRSEPLLQFLTSLDCDYFMKKARNAKHMVFDHKATARALKSALLERRRHGAISKTIARCLRDLVEDAADQWPTSEERFMESLYADYDCYKVFGPDMYDMVRRELAPDCKGFWETIWPEFLKKVAQVPA